MTRATVEYDTQATGEMARVLVIAWRPEVDSAEIARGIETSIAALPFTGFVGMVLDLSQHEDGRALPAVERALTAWAGRVCPVAIYVHEVMQLRCEPVLESLAARGIVCWRFTQRQRAMTFARDEGRVWSASGLRRPLPGGAAAAAGFVHRPCRPEASDPARRTDAPDVHRAG